MPPLLISTPRAISLVFANLIRALIQVTGMFARSAALLMLCALPLHAEPPLRVEIVTARAMAETRTFTLTGELRARDTLNAAFPTGGRIVDIPFEAGAKVARGALLARIDPVQQEQALRAAEAGLVTAEADHRQAREDLDRQDALLSRGATTRIARDSAQDALNIAAGIRAQAQADLARARKALDDTTLLAPEDATVTGRFAEPGQIVGAAQPVMQLALGDGIDAVFSVPEVLLTLGDLPDVIHLSLIERPEARFKGRIAEVSPVVNPYTGTVTVKVAVTDTPPGLIYGEAVRGQTEHLTPPRVVLPYSVISATAAGPAVWLVDPATMAAMPVPVTIDQYRTGEVVLAGGVADGAMIVGKGAQLLYPGRIVAAVGEDQ